MCVCVCVCENMKAVHQKDNNRIEVNAINPNMLCCHEFHGPNYVLIDIKYSCPDTQPGTHL